MKGNLIFPSTLAFLTSATLASANPDVFVEVLTKRNVKRIPHTPINYTQPVNGVVTGDWRDAMPFGGTVRIRFGNKGSSSAQGVVGLLAFRTSSLYSKRALIRAPNCKVSATGVNLHAQRSVNSAGQELWIVGVPLNGAVLNQGSTNDIDIDCEISIPDCTVDEVFAVPLISTTSQNEANIANNGAWLNAASPVDRFGSGEAITIPKPTIVHENYSNVPKHANGHVRQPGGNWPGYTRCVSGQKNYSTGDYFECYFRLVNDNSPQSIIRDIQVDEWGIEVKKLNGRLTALAMFPDQGRGFSARAKFAWSIISPAISVAPDGLGGYSTLFDNGFHGVDEVERAKAYENYCKPGNTDLCLLPNTSPRMFGSFFASKPESYSAQASGYLEATSLPGGNTPSALAKCIFPQEEIRYRTMVDRVGAGTGTKPGNSTVSNVMTMSFFMKFGFMSTPYSKNWVYLPPPPKIGPWRP